MAKLERLMTLINRETLVSDMLKADKLLKKSVTGEDRVMTSLVNGVKENVMTTLREAFRADLKDKTEEYMFLNGARPAGDATEWDAGLDECAENATSPYIDILSNNWLGSATIDARLHEPEEFDGLVKGFSVEAWKNITLGATTPEILASIGIDPVQWAGLFSNPEHQKEKEESERSDLASAIRSIARAQNPETFNPIEVYDLLDNASDSDDLLASGGVSSLIKDPLKDVLPYVRSLQAYRKAHGVNSVQDLLDMVQSEMANPTEEKAVVEVPKPAERQVANKTPAKGKKAKAEPEPTSAPSEEVHIPAGKLNDLQAALGLDDTGMGKLLGVTRQTWAGYKSGKREFMVTHQQGCAIFDALSAKRDEVSSILYDFSAGA